MELRQAEAVAKAEKDFWHVIEDGKRRRDPPVGMIAHTWVSTAPRSNRYQWSNPVLCNSSLDFSLSTVKQAMNVALFIFNQVEFRAKRRRDMNGKHYSERIMRSTVLYRRKTMKAREYRSIEHLIQLFGQGNDKTNSVSGEFLIGMEWNVDFNGTVLI